MINFKRLQSIIDENNFFVITTHVNPDADALGSELALARYLEKLDKKVSVINYSETPYNLQFLDTHSSIQVYNESVHDSLLGQCDVIIFVDLNQLDRVISMKKHLINSNKIKVFIDHHESPKEFTEYLFLDENYSSTGEIIYDLIISANKVELDYDIALYIYSAIMTDTGSFRFERTTSKVHKIAAHLLECGIDPKAIYRDIYDKNNVSKFRLLGRALSSIKLNNSKEIAYMVITKKDIEEAGSSEAEIDNFVNYGLSIKGARISLLFYEIGDGIKISFRTVGNIPANRIAAEFDGGGHFHAAGTKLYGKFLSDYTSKVIATAEKYL
ncbi:bifunctional oligoribonuclease/PAP phosphatase NrnA [Bacteroidota bacterium]